MAVSCLSCCAVLVLSAAVLVGAAPWIVQRLFWYAHRPPAEQTLHVPRFPPDIHDNFVRGIPTNSFVTDSRMDFLEQNFTHRPGDVWVVTYQKVGTTWTQYIVSLLLGNSREVSLFDLVVGTCPMPEVGVGIISPSTRVLLESAASAVRARCFKSHWPRKDFFASLPEKSKVVYVLRDAESVAVSYWNHIFNLFGFYFLKEGDMTWDQYFEKWFHGDLQNGDYFEHVASWWQVQGRENVLILRYEDLRDDTAGTIHRIASFLGEPLDDARLADILDATSKESMRSWNQGLVDRFLITMGIMKGDQVRKDGAAKRVKFTDEQKARMVAKYDALLKPLGVPFDYMFEDGRPSSR